MAVKIDDSEIDWAGIAILGAVVLIGLYMFVAFAPVLNTFIALGN